jgi:hypothetical protein
MDEHQHKDHVSTYPGEAASPEVVPDALQSEPGHGESTATDGINVAQVAMIGTFLALGLLVVVLFLQAWFYHADDAERRDKTVKQDDPTTPYGSMVKEHQAILATGDAPDASGKIHHGLPIDVAMKMVVANPKYLTNPLPAATAPAGGM